MTRETHTIHLDPMRVTIHRLLDEAPRPIPDQAPAVECAVMLRGGGAPIRGVLSETREGMLRMLCPYLDQRGQPVMPASLVEHFFLYSDVMVVAVIRTVTAEPPRIVRGTAG